MSAHARHLLRTAGIAVVVCVVALVAAAMDASAYYTATGTASATASVGTLPAPSIGAASPGAGTVALSWSAVSAPASGAVAYYVSRDGGAASAACPGSASPTSVTSCTDTGVSPGAHQYTVTAVWRTWSASSATADVTVASGAATRLVFTTQPSGAIGGGAFATQPVVTAEDSAGNAVASYSGTVQLSLASGSGTLSGCSGTLRGGVTAFAGCQLDKAGAGDKLQASDGTLSVASSAFSVSVGAAAQLLFTTQPAGASGGSSFTTQPVVAATDAGGNVVTSASGSVTLSLASGTGAAGATLSGCTTPRLRSGVASFGGCTLDVASSGYRLHATSGALGGDSAAFTVSVGSVSRLAFTTQPGGGATGGLALPTQPVVAAQDAGGNTVTTYNRTVTLSITSHTGDASATLSGCSGTLRSGLTTFTGCAIDVASSGYELHAGDGSRSTDSGAFTVAVGPAASLAFTTTPSGATAGSAFSTQPVVAAQDAGGNAVTSYGGTVALSIGSGPGSTLTGCSGSRRSGVTSFGGCRIDTAGSYTLHAGDGTLAGDSASFTVGPGSATALTFTTEPVNALVSTVFPTAPVVTAYDAYGNVATGYASSITLSIKSGTGSSGASLGTCSSNRSNGVTTFTGCKIGKSGTAYQLHASDGTRATDSTAFNVR